MSAPRRFNHDEARRLRAEGWTYRAIAERMGVSVAAVRRVCDPRVRVVMDMRVREFYRAKCHYCGEDCTFNPYGHGGPMHPVPRCRACFNEQQATTVRETELQCGTCREWKPDTDFPWSRSENGQRRGRHAQCRRCLTKQRQDYRERHKVPCACCGAPALPPNEKKGTAYPRCRDCYRARRVPEQEAA